MSDRNLARRAVAEVYFAGVDISASIRPYLLSLTYTDNEEDEADDLQLKLQDRDGIWLTKWLNAAIQAASSVATGASGVAAASTSSYKVTAKSGLNVRKGPGTSYGKLGALSYGSTVEVISTEGGWSKITYSGQTAYVSASYLAATEAPPAEKTEPSVKGLSIQTVIVRENWTGGGKDKVLDCGQFELDSVDASGPPSTVTIKATSLPYSSTIRQTKKSKAWEGYTLSGIAKEMAGANGMACMYESASDPYYERVEQVTESDIALLSRLCHQAGISLKATNNIIVLFDQAAYEAKPSAITIKRGAVGGYEKYKLTTGECDTQYASCRVSYTNPDNGAVITATANADDYDASKKDNQTLEVTAKINSIGEGQALAAKLLRQRNKYEKTASFTLPGNPDVVAGVTVTLSGWGAWDGKYIVKQARHTIGSSGYTTQVTLRHVLEGY